ncbi:MAG: EAL domain-containing protein [Acidimicrobiales bacterium]
MDTASRPKSPQPRRHGWSAAAALLMLFGVVGSLLGAQGVARSDSQAGRQTFDASSMEIASTLKLAIQHEQDLSVSVLAFVTDNPNASEAQFLQWTSSVRAFERYPELEGLAEIEVVPASKLGAFVALASATDPSFRITPSGIRPYYCLRTIWASAPSATGDPAGLDYCATSLGPSLAKAEDSGQGAYVPYKSGTTTHLVVGSPIYRGGVVPATVESRQAALIGWTGTEIVPRTLLATALVGHRATAVAFRHGNGTSLVAFSAGAAPPRAQTMTIKLHNGWSVQIYGASTTAGITGNRTALALAIGGIAVSILLGLLVYLLGTSRSRALYLVRTRTEQLHHQAYHDPLTGLPNRALIGDRLQQMQARSRRYRTPAAALYLDLDNFKDINDTLGHPSGDEVLIAVAARLKAALREEDTVGRMGGDEFVVLVEGSSLSEGPESVAQRILDIIGEPLVIPSSTIPLHVTTSIGIAMDNQATVEELLRDADVALYRAKATGKQRAVIFSTSMQDAVDTHRQLEVDLMGALENGEFFLVYQPVVDLSTGAMTGVEALLRWRHPEKGGVAPSEFIPALESSRLIVEVGRRALLAACLQGATWQRLGHRLTVSVNVSGVQLVGWEIVDDVQAALTASGFDPAMLILEVTETSAMEDVQATIECFHLLKGLGVRLAIDDFGTGYSSMTYLQELPIDVLKIDQSFVSGMGDSTESQAIVHTLVQLGKVLDLTIVAEGIETEDQLLRLQAENVDSGQGYLFARPLSVDSVEALLNDHVVPFRTAA